MLSSLKYLPEDPFDLAALEDSLSKPFTFQKVRCVLIIEDPDDLEVIPNVIVILMNLISLFFAGK
jgi:hypothetical protein